MLTTKQCAFTERLPVNIWHFSNWLICPTARSSRMPLAVYWCKVLHWRGGLCPINIVGHQGTMVIGLGRDWSANDTIWEGTVYRDLSAKDSFLEGTVYRDLFVKDSNHEGTAYRETCPQKDAFWEGNMKHPMRAELAYIKREATPDPPWKPRQSREMKVWHFAHQVGYHWSWMTILYCALGTEC